MKLDRILWGIILLFVGVVLLLENFDIIEFYWRNIWGFWPVFLIIAGVNILFNRSKSQLGSMISIAVLVLTLSFLFYRGQQPPKGHGWMENTFNNDMDIDIDEDSDSSGEAGVRHMNFSEHFNADSARKVVLNISGGGASFKLDGNTDSLITASVDKTNGGFTLTRESQDTTQILTFKMQGKKTRWNMGNGSSDVSFKLNPNPEWDVKMNMGAGEVDFDLSAYKVRTLRFDGGAVALDFKIGQLLPISDVIVKTGVADVKIRIPAASGCRIKTQTGLSSKDFTGFTKLDNGTYETPNFAASKNKIFISLDGGLSNFEVSRY